MRRAALVMVLLASAGCASAPKQAPERQPTPVAASFGRTWDAVIDIFAQRNIPIKTIDRSSGLIVAEQARVDDIENFTHCGKPSLLRAVAGAAVGMGGDGAMRADYNILVRGDSARSTVRANARFATPERECPSKGVFESQFEAAVKSGAESP